MKRTHLFIALLVGISSVLLAGCSHQDAIKPTPTSSADQVRLIQNNPNMPPAAKAAALQQLQQNEAQGATLRNQKK